MYKRDFKGTADGEVSYGTSQNKFGGDYSEMLTSIFAPLGAAWGEFTGDASEFFSEYFSAEYLGGRADQIGDFFSGLGEDASEMFDEYL